MHARETSRARALSLCVASYPTPTQVYTVDWLLIISQVAECWRMWQHANEHTAARFIAMQMKKELNVVQSLRVIIRANIFPIHRSLFFSLEEFKFAGHVVEEHAL